MVLEEVLYYDETSPTGLRWAVDIRCGFHNSILKCGRGSVAGSEERSHWEVTYQQEAHWCHRVIWQLVHGQIPDDMTVDHKDGNGKNNLVANLRLVSHAVNMRNRRMGTNNTSGITGVGRYIDKATGAASWHAKWNDQSGNSCNKRFSVKKFGESLAKTMAIDARNKAIEMLNATGANYSERHGK